MRRTKRASKGSARAPCVPSTPAPSCSTASTGPSTGSPSRCSTLPPSGSPAARSLGEWYGEDLAYIHDVGHADFALGSAPGIREVLEHHGMGGGLIVDLGCGTGLLARELVDAGYDVLGIDISGAMIEIARQRTPEADFRVGSLFEVGIPRCGAVTAISEVLNYLFDPENEGRGRGLLQADRRGPSRAVVRTAGAGCRARTGRFPGSDDAGLRRSAARRGPYGLCRPETGVR